ncbi:MAG: hypothetical protein U0998_11325 [Moraxellaceae bacterium]|nr:hypothetical protein [Moraxellaceae bacterium]MDP1776471.1 hypothetical protein [Moraxellaceae bacterium]MDZ4297503.1 hypothetical protein [Moraxellaceae bacterium]MDZ4387763.1 hypothetical protein [Moraxellaceae bacterium]
MQRLIWGVIILVVVAVLAGLWAILNPAMQKAAVNQMTEPAGVVETVWSVNAQGQVDGPPVLTLQQGQVLRMEVTSAQSEELHVHGYDLLESLPAGETVTVDIFLVHSGRFEVELHKQHKQLTVLEVTPK